MSKCPVGGIGWNATGATMRETWRSGDHSRRGRDTGGALCATELRLDGNGRDNLVHVTGREGGDIRPTCYLSHIADTLQRLIDGTCRSPARYRQMAPESMTERFATGSSKCSQAVPDRGGTVSRTFV